MKRFPELIWLIILTLFAAGVNWNFFPIRRRSNYSSWLSGNDHSSRPCPFVSLFTFRWKAGSRRRKLTEAVMFTRWPRRFKPISLPRVSQDIGNRVTSQVPRIEANESFYKSSIKDNMEIVDRKNRKERRKKDKRKEKIQNYEGNRKRGVETG